MFRPQFTLDATIYPDLSRKPMFVPITEWYTPETDSGVLDSLNWFDFDNTDKKTIAVIPIKYCKERDQYNEFNNLPTWIPVKTNQATNSPLVIQELSQQCFGYPYVITLYPEFIKQEITFGPSVPKTWTKEIVEEIWK